MCEIWKYGLSGNDYRVVKFHSLYRNYNAKFEFDRKILKV